jgi:hypothetical protein
LIAMSFATGWIASFLGMTEFGLHKWSSIGFVVVAGIHLGLHWRGLAAQIRHARGGEMNHRSVRPATVLRAAPAAAESRPAAPAPDLDFA